MARASGLDEPIVVSMISLVSIMEDKKMLEKNCLDGVSVRRQSECVVALLMMILVQ